MSQKLNGAEHHFNVTLWKNRKGTERNESQATLAELASLVRKVSAASKEDLPLLKLASFGDARTANESLRHDANVTAVHGCEGDYDGEKMPMSEAAKRLQAAGIEALLYSTPSSEPEAPRWRIVAPFAQSVTGTVDELRNRRKAMVKRLDAALGGSVLGPESHTLSQSFYLGNVLGRPAVKFLTTHGLRVDELPASRVSEPAAPKPNEKADDVENEVTDNADLVSRIMKGKGRHNAVLSLTARLVADGMKPGKITEHIRGIMDASSVARDAKFKKRYAEVPKMVQDATAKGYAPPKETIERASITVRTGRITEAIDAVGDAMVERAAALGIYVNGSRLVRPVTMVREGFAGSDGKRELVETLELMPRTLATFRTAIDRACAFERWKQDRDKEPYAVKADCPKEIAQALFEAPETWKRWPRIDRIAEVPLFNGKRLDCGPGLVGATWVQAPDVSLPETLDRVAGEAALARVRVILNEFPFATPGDEAAAVALLLTAALRPSLDAAPGFLIDKPDYGAGASTLGRIAGVVATGMPPAVLTVSKNEEEFEKMLGAALIQGRTVIALDNLAEGMALRGKLLTQMLTEQQTETRMLGESRNVICDTARLVFATGVNVSVADDLTRRFIKCRIEPRVENPAERQFKRPNIVEDIRRERVHILRDLYTIAACYLKSSKRASVTPLVGYGLFSRWVAESLVWFGLPDIILSARVARAANPNDVLLARILPVWKSLQGPRGMTVHEVIQNGASEKFAPLVGLLFEATDAKERDGLTPRNVGRWLARMKGRVRGGLRFEIDDGMNNKYGTKWCAKTVARAGDSEDSRDSDSNPPTREQQCCSITVGPKSKSLKSRKSPAVKVPRGASRRSRA
jgi:hypothetical protein